MGPSGGPLRAAYDDRSIFFVFVHRVGRTNNCCRTNTESIS